MPAAVTTGHLTSIIHTPTTAWTPRWVPGTMQRLSNLRRKPVRRFAPVFVFVPIVESILVAMWHTVAKAIDISN